MDASIFADRSEPRTSLAREPRPIAITRLVPRPRAEPPSFADAPVVIEPEPLDIAPSVPPPPPAAIAGPHDARLAAILGAPLATGETTHAGFARKERELGTAFAQLGVLDARALHQRLANPRAGDMLAATFARLTVERRTRLLAFLADARRRAAVMGR